jgi:hypothetical protein
MKSEKNPNAGKEKSYFHIKVRSFLRARMTLMKSISQKQLFVDGLYLGLFEIQDTGFGIWAKTFPFKNNSNKFTFYVDIFIIIGIVVPIN